MLRNERNSTSKAKVIALKAFKLLNSANKETSEELASMTEAAYKDMSLYEESCAGLIEEDMAKPDETISDSNEFEDEAYQAQYCEAMSQSLSSIIQPGFKLFKQYEEGILTIAQKQLLLNAHH